MALRKVRVQLLNETTGALIDEVDVLTSAECVTFSDGETFQQKLNAGKLKGDKGNTGDRGPAGANGATGATGAKGATGTSMRFKGAWSSSTAYVCDSLNVDIVTSGGNTYRCKSNHTNQPITNSTYWELVAQKGATGDKGATGGVGPAGPQGPAGAQGPKGDTGDSVTVGSTFPTGEKRKLFFKLV